MKRFGLVVRDFQLAGKRLTPFRFRFERNLIRADIYSLTNKCTIIRKRLSSVECLNYIAE